MIYILDNTSDIKELFKKCIKRIPQLIYFEMFDNDDFIRIKRYSKNNVFYVLKINIFLKININDVLKKIFNRLNFFNIVILYDTSYILRQTKYKVNNINDIIKNISEKKRIITYLTIIEKKPQPNFLFSNVLSAVLPFIIYFL